MEIELFLIKYYEDDIISEVLRRIIWFCGWLWGKYSAGKYNAKVDVQHYETLCSSIGTSSLIVSTNAKNGEGGKKSNGGVGKSNNGDT